MKKRRPQKTIEQACLCGRTLKINGYRETHRWMGYEVSAWCDACMGVTIYYDADWNLKHMERRGENTGWGYYEDDTE